MGTFFGAIADKKEFDYDRENHVSMGGEGHVEVEDQAGDFVLLSNDKIDAMKKDYIYADFFREG